MKDLSGKVAVVTGAGSGIGRGLALNFAAEGCDICLNDFNAENLAETVEMVKAQTSTARIYSQVFDVSHQEDMERFAEQCIAEMGHVDIVINNAGVALGGYTAETVPMEEFKWVMDINFYGMVYGSKAFITHLRSRPEACLANVSSVFGMAGVAKQAAYCSSKFAIRGFTESMRMEAMNDYPHVNILSIHPGGIKTNIVKNSRWDNSGMTEEEKDKFSAQFDDAFINTADYAAKTIIRGVKKNKKRVLIGKDARHLWRIVNWFPVRYTQILARTMLKPLADQD